MLTNWVNISAEDYWPCVVQNNFNTHTKRCAHAKLCLVYNTAVSLKLIFSFDLHKTWNNIFLDQLIVWLS